MNCGWSFELLKYWIVIRVVGYSSDSRKFKSNNLAGVNYFQNINNLTLRAAWYIFIVNFEKTIKNSVKWYF